MQAKKVPKKSGATVPLSETTPTRALDIQLNNEQVLAIYGHKHVYLRYRYCTSTDVFKI